MKAKDFMIKSKIGWDKKNLLFKYDLYGKKKRKG